MKLVDRIPSSVLTGVIAPLLALTLAMAVSALALVISGNSPLDTFASMWAFGTRADSIVIMVNNAIPLYVSGIAFAIAFKLGLFNIGVEGQYRIAALVAAGVGAGVSLPPVLHVPFVLLVAVGVGALWAGIAGLLKVWRGVHEVISTIMLNTIATGLGAYLLGTYLRERIEGDLVTATHRLPESARLPDLTRAVDALGIEVRAGPHGFVVLAIMIGVAYYVLVWRTRFGYDLRASGLNPWAARASGVDSRRMPLYAMLLSGGVAGLVGMSSLLGPIGRYSIDFPTGLGFDGIAVALLGRNHPGGIAIGALLFGFLRRSAQILDLEGIPKEIVTIMTGVIVLTVVIVYEVVTRWAQAQETRRAAQAAGDAAAAGAPA